MPMRRDVCRGGVFGGGWSRMSRSGFRVGSRVRYSVFGFRCSGSRLWALGLWFEAQILRAERKAPSLAQFSRLLAYSMPLGILRLRDRQESPSPMQTHGTGNVEPNSETLAPRAPSQKPENRVPSTEHRPPQ